MTESTKQTDRAAATAAPATPRSRRRFWRWAGIAGLVVGVAGMAACGHGPHGGGRHHGGPFAMHESADPETVARRVDKAVDWVLSDVQASAEQKQKVSAIARQTITDLAPLRDKHRAARQSAVNLMAAPTIDRAAIESLRAEQMQMADQASRRVSQALADVADVLTPEQRVKLKERLDKRMAGRRWS